MSPTLLLILSALEQNSVALLCVEPGKMAGLCQDKGFYHCAC